MADEKKYDDISPANEGSIAGETTSAKVMPLYADERGYHEKDEGYDDQVVIRPIDPNGKDGSVQRNLKSRHVAMIAIGGTIGTGLFVGSGGALAAGGPVGVWLGYIFMSTMVYAMMVALGEMVTLYPVAGAFTHYATRFLDPAFGFALGWNYFYSWAITLPVEMVACAIIINYWNTSINNGVWIAIGLVCVCSTNFLGVKVYGELEFWFSLIKVIAIIGLILMGIILDAGGGPSGDAIGFRYWKNPGPFNTVYAGDTPVGGSWGHFLAFWSSTITAAFSFLGTEIVAVTAGEAANPRKTMPGAIRRVFWRLLMFYVLGIWVISVLVPYDEPRLTSGGGDARASPFVIAIDNAGIKGLPHVVNAVLLVAAWSAGNSDLYASSRVIYALALEGKAPAIFRRCTKGGVPVYAVALTALFGLLGFLCVQEGKTEDAFNWLYNLSTITGLIAWSVILASYLRFYYGAKRQGLNRRDFPYVAPFQPYLSWYGFIVINLIILFNGYLVFLRGNWNTTDFIVAYISLPIFVAFALFWKLFKKSKWVSLDEMDFMTGRRELDEMDREEREKYAKPTSIWGKFAAILF
ncbi:hypothetical protein NliqN6_3845 [Naganishia liquefaciens]|uniref:Amino acid permease/ SLC12A domain-containing protein n=1 Tax=Naganishia liquefaciens TaxID=104408 RepID=A0A8H3YFM9_9TREE|nr:hypothetical protein NliqN6_3845 [Naganishia liquefaciens]